MSLIKTEPSVPSAEYILITDDVKYENQLEEMISEEIVVTSDDPFLCDISEDKYSSRSSACSETDERGSDQGYESVDSPESLSGYDESLMELFPNLI